MKKTVCLLLNRIPKQSLKVPPTPPCIIVLYSRGGGRVGANQYYSRYGVCVGDVNDGFTLIEWLAKRELVLSPGRAEAGSINIYLKNEVGSAAYAISCLFFFPLSWIQEKCCLKLKRHSQASRIAAHVSWRHWHDINVVQTESETQNMRRGLQLQRKYLRSGRAPVLGMPAVVFESIWMCMIEHMMCHPDHAFEDNPIHLRSLFSCVAHPPA
jgi:hypothetical protein